MGVLILAASLVAAIVVFTVDARIEAAASEEELKGPLRPRLAGSLRRSRCTLNEALTRSFTSHNSQTGTVESTGTFEKQATPQGGSFRHSGLRGSIPELSGEAPYKPLEPASASALEEGEEEVPEVEVSLWDIQDFGASFWMLSAGCVVVYATVNPNPTSFTAAHR